MAGTRGRWRVPAIGGQSGQSPLFLKFAQGFSLAPALPSGAGHPLADHRLIRHRRRNREPELCAVPLRRFHPYPPAVPLHDSPADREPDAGALIFAPMQPLERVENRLVIIRLNPDAVVFPRKYPGALFLRGAEYESSAACRTGTSSRYSAGSETRARTAPGRPATSGNPLGLDSRARLADSRFQFHHRRAHLAPAASNRSRGNGSA